MNKKRFTAFQRSYLQHPTWKLGAENGRTYKEIFKNGDKYVRQANLTDRHHLFFVYRIINQLEMNKYRIIDKSVQSWFWVQSKEDVGKRKLA